MNVVLESMVFPSWDTTCPYDSHRHSILAGACEGIPQKTLKSQDAEGVGLP